MATPDMDVIKDIPGYKVILKAILKTQIQQLVEQLAAHTDEESVILTASVADGTLSHLGSDSGKGFLEDHEDVKSQFLGFCLKRHHKKKQAEKDKERQQQMLESMHQMPIPAQMGFGPAPRRNPRSPYPRQILPRPPGPGMSLGGGMRSPNVRHEPYPMIRPQRNSIGSLSDSVARQSLPTTPVKQEPSESSNDGVNEPNNASQSPSQSVLESKDDDKSNSSSSTIPNEGNDGNVGDSSDREKQNTEDDIDPNINVKVESITESEMELEITGVEPGRPIIPPDWDPNISLGMNFDPETGAMGSPADMQQGYSFESDKSTRFVYHQCEYCSKCFSSKGTLQRHMLLHTGGDTFSCEICHKEFNRQCNLKRHLVVHSDEKRFECTLCSKTFKRIELLKCHMSVHSNEKRFICEVCNKGFTRNTGLKKHRVTHLNQVESKYEIDTSQIQVESKYDVDTHLNEVESKFEIDNCLIQAESNCDKDTHLNNVVSE